jgi:uncharacterized protein Yka (UPF0111/DUF47 family)
VTENLIARLKRLTNRLFQHVSDPSCYIDEQCDIAMEAMEIFLNYLHDGNEEHLAKIETVNKHRNEVNTRTYNILNRESVIPENSKDIYRAFLSLDMVIKHIRISTMEIKLQQLSPDEHMLQMAKSLKLGVECLQRGFKQLTTNRAHAQEDAHAARGAANDTKNVFTRALTDIILTQEHSKSSAGNKVGVNAKTITAAVDHLKRHMIYNHLTKTADRVTWASEQLYGLSIKYH